MSETIERTRFKSSPLTALANFYFQLRNQTRDLWRKWISRIFARGEERVEWRALAKTFFKLGVTGFGGGLAVIAHTRRVVVYDRRWMSEEEFLDAVSLAQSLPGANTANAITYIGLKLCGIRGALVSVASFILPSFLAMIGLAIAYGHLINFPDAKSVFQGFNAAVVGLIAATTVRLGQSAMRQQWRLELGVAAGFMLIFTQTTVAEVVLLAGIIGILIHSYKARARTHIRQRWRKERQTRARGAVAEQQARQHAAEMMEHADEPTELGADYKVEVSLPQTPSSEKSPDEISKESNNEEAGNDKPGDDETGNEPGYEAPGNDKPGNDETGNEPGYEAPGNEEPERPPVREEEPPVPDADKKGASTRLRAFALIPLILLFAWPILEKMITVWHLITIFLRVGTITFGGGYVMVPQIENDVVEVNKWMDHQTFADGVAFGQITPGPVLITATFIGYKVAGAIGAIMTTIAAFLPSFVMTLIAGTSINRFRTNFHVQAFLAGVAPAVVGMLAAAGVTMAKSGVSGATGFGIATLSCLLMLRAKLNPVVIIFGCGLLQWVISRGLLGVFTF
ncbi:MAG TPA: chromate transporter [Blastocatellia bacterium]|nr:chromate transporter [Blastocatellia bacterium]